MVIKIDHFQLEDIQNNDYKSEKKTYRYFSIFETPCDCSEIYNYSIDFISHMQSINCNTFKTIRLYTKKINGYIHEIYKISTDCLDNTIRETKFEEDIEISPPFNVYVQVETFNILLILSSQNTAKEVLRPTFKLEGEHLERRNNGFLEKRLYLKTKVIEGGEQTKKQVFNLCVPYLTDYQLLHKKDLVEGKQITKSCYELIICNEVSNEKIYSCEIDTYDDYLDEEKTYESSTTPVIIKPYSIQLIIYLFHDPEQQHNDELDEQEEMEELIAKLSNLREELSTYQNKVSETNKCIKLETCVCLTNPSNIILTDCGHQCICRTCSDKLTELKCPLCRTTITQSRLII